MQAHDPLGKHQLDPRERQRILDVESRGVAFVACRDSAGQLQIFELSGRDDTVGRAGKTTVSLTWDSSVSSLHAELDLVGGSWLVVDDDLSANGTFVDGRRVRGRRRLRNADTIRFGRTVAAFRSGRRDGELLDTTDELSEEFPSREQLTDNDFAILKALCRPMIMGSAGAPASQGAVALEVHLQPNTVAGRMSKLYTKFKVGADDDRRKALAEAAIASGLVHIGVY